MISSHIWRGRWLAWVLIAVTHWATSTWAAEATTLPSRLLLQPTTPVSEAWPFVTVLSEKQTPLTLAEAQAAIAEFERPQTSYATLGVQPQPTWLHVPFRVEAVSGMVSQQWVMNIDYPPLNRIDAYVIQDGRTLQKAELGSLRTFASRPLFSRSHAMPLDLAAGDYDLMLRVESRGATILPIEFMQPSAFHRASVAEQMLRGIQVGFFLCMLMYSLAQWVGTRESLFLKYALLVTGSFLFALLLSGVGAQWVWRDVFWFERHMAGIGSLVAVAGTFLFLGDVLRRPHTGTADKPADRFPRLMNSGAVLCGVLLVIYCLDAFNTRLLTAMIVLLGPLPLLLSLPRFMSKVTKGDAVGLYLLLAFAFYITTVVVTTSTIRGKLPANVWTLHSLTFGEMCHILAFTLVLIVRATELRKASENARTEHEVMRSMAYADALTGLPNRRSLTDAMSLALVSASPHHMLAVYLIDLDEFKEVNDTRGHEVGDQLLIEVANRLRAGTRSGDAVARLGGDEFVMVASGLRDPAQARQIGEHLLSLFETPVHVAGEEMRVGLTIGYAVASGAAHETATLLRMADGALYQGKQCGKGRLQQA
ncbi:sensor domain-containing diguanylate cyclase [Acidovorax sp. D2M1]|uniref:Sensor domain-containing diguanylate cyclase n=1 Tax=Acidovorax benzenivorans TaxID=2987520 RepID=A0ABT5S0Q6_9BURK|nr:diguanylate cyclase [Acidovorax benzenivorans]MDD2178912.1 sensor domain-containing diguanylate cyclase [Acidovorax benzenivorans]